MNERWGSPFPVPLIYLVDNTLSSVEERSRRHQRPITGRFYMLFQEKILHLEERGYWIGFQGMGGNKRSMKISVHFGSVFRAWVLREVVY